MARASNLVIGTLTLALIAGSLGGWLGYQKLAGIKQLMPFRVVFEGSASGLRNGASVNFAGIRIGEVVSMRLDNRAASWRWPGSRATPRSRRTPRSASNSRA